MKPVKSGEKACFETLQEVYALLDSARRSLNLLSEGNGASMLKLKTNMALQAIEESGLGIHLRNDDLN